MGTHQHNDYVHRLADNLRYHPRRHAQPSRLYLTVVDRGVKPRPFFKEAVLRTRGLDGLYHFHARHGHGTKLPRVARTDAGYVRAFHGDHAVDEVVDDQ